MNYILAVDGGGTKTEFCVSDRQGNIIGTFLTESTNFKSVGIEQCRSNLEAGIRQLKERLGIGMEDLAYSVFGISGCDSAEDQRLIEGRISSLGFAADRFYLCNDSILAYYAQAEEPGMVVISGTGSIVLGIDRNRAMKRGGGWGYNISDIGSGYWLGNETAKQTLLYCDGCLPASELYEAVREDSGAEDFAQLPYRIMEYTTYQDIARLSQILIRQYEAGTAEARYIVEAGIDTLAETAAQIYRRMKLQEEAQVCVVLSGGVMKNASVQQLFRKLFTEKIDKQNAEFRMQENQPAYGGLKLAMRILEGNGQSE